MNATTWVVEGTTLIKPETRDQALRIASRWEEQANGWEEGSAERIHCQKVADAFRRLATELS